MLRGLIFLLIAGSLTCCTGVSRKNSKEEELLESKVRLTPSTTVQYYYFSNSQASLLHFISAQLKKADKELSELLGELPKQTVTVALVEQKTFFKETDTPKWISAIYHKGRIFIPVEKKGTPDRTTLARSLRHEYAHAVLDSISPGELPAWLDEGFAVWFEGELSIGARHRLSEWVRSRNPISLSELQKSFTTLPRKRVKIAYSQSRFAVELLFERFGMERFRKGLEQAPITPHNFKEIFGMTQHSFEGLHRKTLTQWSNEFIAKNQL